MLNTKNEKKQPVTDSLLSMTVLLVVCNEQENIENKINNLTKIKYGNKGFNIYIIDDASTDSTLDIIQSMNNPRIKLYSRSNRNGKASCINYGMQYITTDLVFMVDTRQMIDNMAAEYLAAWFSQYSNVGAVSGELNFYTDSMNSFSKGVDGYWKYELFIRKNESKLSSVPGVTGAIYMLRKEVFVNIPEDTILDDVAIPMNAIKAGYTVKIDDRAKAWDVPSIDKENEKKRKIRTISGNYQLLFRNPSWIVPYKHQIWWQFLSHKILRLFAPFFILLHLATSVYIAFTNNVLFSVYSVLLVSLIIIYPLSLFFPVINKLKFIRLWNSFIVLNIFNVLAFFNYFLFKQNGSWKEES